MKPALALLSTPWLLAVAGSDLDNSDHYVFCGDTAPFIYQDLSIADLASTCLVSKKWHKNTLSELETRYNVDAKIEPASTNWKLIVENFKALASGQDVGIRFLRYIWPKAYSGSHDMAFLRFVLIEVIAFITGSKQEDQIRRRIYEANVPAGYTFICDLLSWIQSMASPPVINAFENTPNAQYYLETENPSYDLVADFPFYELFEIAKAGRADILLKVAEHFGLSGEKSVFDLVREYQGSNREAVAFTAFYFVGPEKANELADLLEEFNWIEQGMWVESLAGTNFPEGRLLQLISERADSPELTRIMGYWPEGVKKAIKTIDKTANNGNDIENLLFALANDMEDQEVIHMLKDLSDQDFSKPGFFAICLGRSQSLAESFLSINEVTTVNIGNMFIHLHHLSEHLATFLATNHLLCVMTFMRLRMGKALGPSLEFLEASLPMISDELVESSIYPLMLNLGDSRLILTLIKHIVLERKGSDNYDAIMKTLKSVLSETTFMTTCLTLFLLSEMDEMLVEERLLNYGTQGLMSLLDI